MTNDTFAPLRALRWKRPARDARRAAGPADVARAARGGGSLVARGAADRIADRARSTPRRSPCSTATGSSPARRSPAEGGRRRVLRRLPDPPRARGGRPDPARLLRRRARAPPSSRSPARSSGCDPSASPARGAADATVHLLAAADPANPYGAAIAWPRRGEDDRRPLQRAAGAYVVLVDGVAALYVDRGGGSIQVLPAADEPEIGRGRGPAPRRARRPTAGSASW